MAAKNNRNNSGLIRVLVIMAIALIVVSGILLAREYQQRRPVAARTPFPSGAGQTAAVGQTGQPGVTSSPDGTPVSVDKKLVIDGIVFTGVPQDNARRALEQNEQAFRDKAQFTIVWGDKTWTISPSDMEISSDWESVLQTAYGQGQDGSYEVTRTVTVPRLDEFISSIASQIDVAPQNAALAGYDEDSKTFAFTDDVPGAQLDREQLKYAIESACVNADFGTVIQANVITADAEITKQYLEENFAVMASFTTTAKNDAARNTNIKIALAAFNGRILKPGEQISFNGTTGERTMDKGYQVAGVILDGASGEDVGGGICQVSSTMFNAVVRAGLEVTQRSPHTYPSDYINAGMDAMVNWPDSDLKFINSSKADVYLYTSFDSSTRKLTVSIYGVPIYSAGMKVELRSERYEYIPQPEDIITLNEWMYVDEVAVARKGRAGSKWRTYRQFFDSQGNLLYEEELCTSVYAALANKLVVGTMIRE